MNASGTNAPATVIALLLLAAAAVVFRLNLASEWILPMACRACCS